MLLLLIVYLHVPLCVYATVSDSKIIALQLLTSQFLYFKYSAVAFYFCILFGDVCLWVFMFLIFLLHPLALTSTIMFKFAMLLHLTQRKFSLLQLHKYFLLCGKMFIFLEAVNR